MKKSQQKAMEARKAKEEKMNGSGPVVSAMRMTEGEITSVVVPIVGPDEGVRPPPICVGENRRPWRKKGKESRIGHCGCDDAGCADGAGDVGTFEGDEDSKEVSNFGSFDKGSQPVT